MSFDVLIVGAGLTGATIARRLHDQGWRPLVVDRRRHVGGNVHDHAHPSGIRIHTYGPHYFRTSAERIWTYVRRFAEFYPYEAVLMTSVDNRFEHWPIHAEYIERSVGKGWKPEFTGVPRNFEEASLAMMPAPVYRKFVKGYTEKQWGVVADELSADLAGRFDVRQDGDVRLKRSRYQGIPKEGYAAFMDRMLQGIPVLLNFDYLRNREVFRGQNLTVFTGPVDEYFDYDAGRLEYRSQRREHTYHPDATFQLPVGQVNFPLAEHGAHVRLLEWKHMMEPEYAAQIGGTVITSETPFSPVDSNEYEYPFPSERNRRLYEAYEERARRTDGLLVCGRLGEYRYFDMDQAIARAMMIADRILGGEWQSLRDQPLPELEM